MLNTERDSSGFENSLLLDQAKKYFSEKKYKKSFIELIAVSSKLSNSSDYLKLMAEVLGRLGDVSGQIKALETLKNCTTMPTDALTYMNALISDGQLNVALDVGFEIEEKRLTRPEFTQLLHNFIHIYIKENDFEGLSEITQRCELSQILSDKYFYAKSLLFLQSNEEDEAIKCLRRSLEINPHFDEAWVALALMHNKKGDRVLAIANLERALDVNPYNKAAIKHCVGLISQEGLVEKALEKVQFYLQNHNFDETLTLQHIDLLSKANKNDLAWCEEIKLSYFFGK